MNINTQKSHDRQTRYGSDGEHCESRVNSEGAKVDPNTIKAVQSVLKQYRKALKELADR